ncbi:MAG TPA: N-formylglutamate amidohydrolase [Candidatus Udaeobacter sp.]|nr:N-formylglutamate amidohydrolase [Candidatus Udaeobacter sp.]
MPDMLSLTDYRWTSRDFSWVFEFLPGSPVIMTVPHDRGFSHFDLLGFLEPRKDGVKGRDKHVWPIAKDIMSKFGINAVRGLFPRHFIDYNRSPQGINYYPLSQKKAQTAFDDESLQPIYDVYHEAVADLIMKSILKYGKERCLLIDLHGFTTQPPYGDYDLIFGTGNRVTINNSSIDQLLADFFSARGYKVFLPLPASMGPLEDWYSADFTTRHYAQRFGIDAIQIEVAKRFRTEEGVDAGRRLSVDFAEFFRSNFNL